MSTSLDNHPVVSDSEWLTARKELLATEKAFTRQRDDLSRQRRDLPWRKIEKTYVFDGPDGPETLADLFQGRNQLIVYHFMFAPDWSQGCQGCSFVGDHLDPTVVHLRQRDVSLTMISRAPLDKLLAFRERMGWSFPWVSSFQNDFHRDFRVFFTPEEVSSGLPIYNFDSLPSSISDLPGLSVFAKNDDGDIFHTYSTYARGLDIFLTTYHLLDTVPKGRDEDGMPTMAWLRHHDRYDDPDFVAPWQEQVERTTR